MDRLELFQKAYIAAGDDLTKLKQVCIDYPDKWGEFANELAKEGESQAAINHYEVALGISNNPLIRACALNEIGRVHANAGQTVHALGFFKKALELNQNHSGILANIGLCNRWAGNLDEAEKWLKRSLSINPWEANAALEISFVKMLQGNYLNGFELYESRFRSPGLVLKKLECDKPEWDGTNGKNLFVYGEQGAGDIFLMLRYAKLIKELGLRQSWVVHKSMRTLVEKIKEIDVVLVDGDQHFDFDCHIPAASLPRIFKTAMDNVPAPVKFEGVEPVDYGEGFHVGIVWRGNKTQSNDLIRSTNLKRWNPVLDVAGINFHSLQVDGADEALAYPAIKMYPMPKDWSETASRVAGLDLVISVDTSMVHLAGSLGVPTLCALHCRPYFVFPLVTEKCPWYDSVKLFKQKKEFEWQPVFENIANELRNIVNKNTV